MLESAQSFINRIKQERQILRNRYAKTGKGSCLKCFPDIGRMGKHCVLKEAETLMTQSNISQKILIIERFRLVRKIGKTTWKLKIGNIEYRLGYYIVGKNGNKKDKWTWGESCPIIPEKDFLRLINMAKKEGTIR